MKSFIRDNIKRIITTAVLLTALLAACFAYNKALAAEYTGDIVLDTENLIDEYYFYSLSGGDYSLTVGYSSDSDQKITITSLYSGTLFDGTLPAGEDIASEIDFAVPNDDCHIDITFGESVNLSSAVLHSDVEIFKDSLFKSLLLFVIGAAVILFLVSNIFIKAPWGQKLLWIGLGLAVLIHCYPLWLNSMPVGYDGTFHMGRLVGIYDAVHDRQFPATIYTNAYNGFGLPGREYPQLFLYPFAALKFFHMSTVGAYDVMVIAMTLLAALIMYLSVRKITGSDISASLAGIFFLMFTYHLDDAFMRNAVGETFSLCFLPLIVTGIFIIANTEEKRGWLWILIGCTGVLNSHVLSCILAAVLIFLLIIVNIRKLLKWDKIRQLIFSAVLIILVNATTLVSLLTFLIGGLNTDNMMVPYVDNLTPILCAFNLKEWGLPTIGKISLLFVILMTAEIIISVIRKENETDSCDNVIPTLLIIGIITIFLASDVLPWNLIERVSVIKKFNSLMQYSYRYFSLTAVCLSMGAAVSVERIMNLLKKNDLKAVRIGYSVLPALMVVLALLSGSIYVSSYSHQGYYSRILGGMDVFYSGSYLPKGASEGCWSKEGVPFLSNANINIISYEKNGTHINCTFNVSEDYNHIDFPLFDYPGYTAKYSTESGSGVMNLPITRGDEGRIRVVLPKSDETATVAISYKGPASFYIGYLISLLTIAVIIVRFSFKKKKA